MEKSKKADWVAKIKQSFVESDAVFAVNQNKLTVAETESLRKQLKNASSSYVVTKNTLARLAVKDTAFECLATHLSGQTAVVFSKDITGAAKVISEFAAKNEGKLTIVCGGYQGKLLNAKEVDILAKLPSMDELRATLVALIQTPAQRLVRLSQEPAGQIARVLKSYSEK